MKHRHSGKYKSRTKKGKVVYKRKPRHKHTLKKTHRDIFQRLDRKPYEVGGYMDFNERGFERADVYVGSGHEVSFEANPDKEISYHTHPTEKKKWLSRANHFPSKADVMEFGNYPSQTMLIFHEGKVTALNKRRKLNITRNQLNRIEGGIEKDSTRLTVNQLMEKYKPLYKKMGLDLKYIKHKGALKIPFRVVEPVRKGKMITKRSYDDERVAEQEVVWPTTIPFADPAVVEEKTQEIRELETALAQSRERERLLHEIELERKADEAGKEVDLDWTPTPKSKRYYD